MDPRPEPEFARRGGQVGRGDRVLEERLDAGDEDAGTAAPPRGERGDPGGRLVGDQLAALIGQGCPRLEDGHGRRIAQPRTELLGHPVADLRVAGDPHQPFATGDLCQGGREIALGAVRHGHQADVAARPTRAGIIALPGSEAPAELGERARGGEQGRQGGQVGQPMTGALPTGTGRRAGRARLRPDGRRRRTGWPPRILDLGVDRGDVEVDLVLGRGGACRVAKSVATRSAIRRSRPRRPRSGVSGTLSRPYPAAGRVASRSSSGAPHRRRAGRPPRRRPPDGSCRRAGARTC